MRCNENTKIIGKRIILVPYCAKHVEKYHKWMQDPELLELTASEPLTLEEERAMQRSWREDEDKLTFLVLSREIYDATGDEIAALVGDTNLFVREVDSATRECLAEAEIMIAEKSMRGKGYGWEAMCMMLQYGQKHVNIKNFEAKIGMNNEKSLRMFEKMNFNEVSRSEVFQEITMRCLITDTWLSWLDTQVTLDCRTYEEENNDDTKI